MTINTIATTVLTASDGMMLTDGRIYGKEVYLAHDRSAADFYEIPTEEYEILTAGGQEGTEG